MISREKAEPRKRKVPIFVSTNVVFKRRFSVKYFVSIMAEGTKENGNSNRWKPLSTGIKSLLIPVIESRQGSTYFRNSLINLK